MAEVLGHGAGRLAGVDERRGVEVAECVHAIASSRLHTGGDKGGAPDVAIDVVAVERLVLPTGEDEIVVTCGEPAQVLRELHGHPLGQRHGSRSAALGLVDDDSPPDDLDLLLDPQLLPQEVDVTDPQAEDLALTQPAPAATTAIAR